MAAVEDVAVGMGGVGREGEDGGKGDGMVGF
jgi:hypothetical protein